MTPALPVAFVILACLLVLAWGIRNPEQRPTAVSEEQRRRRLENAMREQDERWFGEWQPPTPGTRYTIGVDLAE